MGKMSGRSMWKIRNISAVQRPMPLSAVELLDDVFIVGIMPGMRMDGIVCEGVGEALQVSDFLSGKAAGTQGVVTGG